MGFYYTALVSQALVLHELVCLMNHGGVTGEPWAYARVCASQVLAKLYELALGVGVGYVVRETLLLFQRWSALVREKGYTLWVLVLTFSFFSCLGLSITPVETAFLSSLMC